MNIILLSGGSGKRLWPLSNEKMSKQFLSLLPKDEEKSESMVQRVYRQIKAADPKANIVVSTNAAQKGSLLRQLGEDVDVVIEPERRNTFPAVLLATAYLRLEKKLHDDDIVIVLPIDVFAEENYFNNLFLMEEALKKEYNIMLMGAKPTYPSEKYGYVVPCEYAQGETMRVKEFKEKPDKKTAQALIKNNALWNCGIFGFKISYVMNALNKIYAPKDFDDLVKNYYRLEKDSFDYQVVEKESSIGLIEYVGKWKDLGTWNTLTEEMGRQSVGSDVIIADSCNNTHVLNMLDTPVIAMGLNNVVVVASHDGILVSEKTESSYLKPFADKINQRPMYEQRIWGEYRVLDYISDESTLTKRMHIKQGMQISYQYHENRTEVWTVTRGEGLLLMDGVKSTVKRGDVINIPPMAKHAMKAVTDLEFIEVQIGNGENMENDIVKLSEEW